MPIALNLAKQALLVLLGAFLDLLALRRKIARELIGVPFAEWFGNIVLPIVLHQVLEVLAVCRSRVRNVVV